MRGDEQLQWPACGILGGWALTAIGVGCGGLAVEDSQQQGLERRGREDVGLEWLWIPNRK